MLYIQCTFCMGACATRHGCQFENKCILFCRLDSFNPLSVLSILIKLYHCVTRNPLDF